MDRPYTNDNVKRTTIDKFKLNESNTVLNRLFERFSINRIHDIDY